MNPILDEIAKTSIQLMLKEPFFGHFFTSILKDVSDKTGSISLEPAATGMFKLIVNEDYWKKHLTTDNDEKTKELRYGAVKHQILHLVLKHILRVGDFGNKKLFNIAADLVANQYIKNTQLPEDAITLNDFPHFKLSKDQSLDYYYKRIQEEMENMDNNSMGGLDQNEEQNQEDEEQEEQDGQEMSDEEQDEENQKQDQEDQDENDQDDKDSHLNSSQKKLRDLMKDDNNLQMQQHESWDSNQVSPAQAKLMDNMLNEAIMNAWQRTKSTQPGTMPGYLEQYLQELLEELQPNVNWRRMLRLFMASSMRTFLKSTIQRVSKRYGTAPGIKIKRYHKVLVVIDTSGSIDLEQLNEFFSEIYHIWKRGAEVMVLECDVEIHNSYIYKGQLPEAIKGRGGTDFNPPLQFANEVYKPDAIIYFTDGFAAAPEIKSLAPLMWLVSQEGVSEEEWDYLPGRKIKMVRMKV